MSRSPETRQPPPLSHHARSVLHVYREGNRIPSGAESRILHALKDDQASPKATRRPLSLPLWTTVALAAAFLVTLGLRWLGSSRMKASSASEFDVAVDERERDEPNGLQKPSTPAPPSTATSLPGMGRGSVSGRPSPPVTRIEEAPTESQGVRSRPRRGPTSRPLEEQEEEEQEKTSRVGVEHQLIAEAWDALVRGDLSAARSKANTHASSFPNGVLQPERRAIEAIVDCKLSQGSSKLAEAFLHAHPHSPLASRVRSVCEKK